MPSAVFYGLLQIPLEDFTSPALKRKQQKRVDGAGSTTAAPDMSNRRMIREYGRTGRRQRDIYFPSAKS